MIPIIRNTARTEPHCGFCEQVLQRIAELEDDKMKLLVEQEAASELEPERGNLVNDASRYEKVLEEVLDERDRYHEVADALAECIERITGIDNGEHTSANCPWRNAEESAESYVDGRDAPVSSCGVSAIAAERQRQIEREGWSPEHDDTYTHAELLAAAECYVHTTRIQQLYPDLPHLHAHESYWPWPDEWWKPGTARRNLEKAGALIAAEIDRLDRKQAVGGGDDE